VSRAALIAGLLGLALITALVAHSGYHELTTALAAAGWGLLWLVPFRLVPLSLDAYAWRHLLRASDLSGRARWPYLLWVATVREAVNRLLPVASIGGELIGIRLVAARGIAGARAAASVVVEVMLTLINQYVFSALGLALLVMLANRTPVSDALVWGLAFALPVPAAFALVLRYGNLFQRIGRMAQRLLGDGGRLRELIGHSSNLDAEIRKVCGRRRELWAALAWQFGGIVIASFETWLALQLLGHPVDAWAAVTLESLTTTVRYFAFMVPAAIGVQEAGLVLFGQLVGIDPQIALALSLAKRAREVMFGLPALVSWQWAEGLRLRARIGHGSGTFAAEGLRGASTSTPSLNR
jgi:putative membrane protein